MFEKAWITRTLSRAGPYEPLVNDSNLMTLMPSLVVKNHDLVVQPILPMSFPVVSKEKVCDWVPTETLRVFIAGAPPVCPAMEKVTRYLSLEEVVMT